MVDEVKAWQARPLDPVYPIVYLDCIHVKVRDGVKRLSVAGWSMSVGRSGIETGQLDWQARASFRQLAVEVI